MVPVARLPTVFTVSRDYRDYRKGLCIESLGKTVATGLEVHKLTLTTWCEFGWAEEVNTRGSTHTLQTEQQTFCCGTDMDIALAQLLPCNQSLLITGEMFQPIQNHLNRMLSSQHKET